MDAMMSSNNTGLHVMSNVHVLANPSLGIEAYTIDKLMWLDNTAKDGSAQNFFGGEEVASSLGEAGYPYGSSLSVPTSVAVSMVLNQEWKVRTNADVLQEALAA